MSAILAAYQVEFLRVNGYACEIVKTERGGWYAICEPGTFPFLIPANAIRWRLSELVELTANLKTRYAADPAARQIERLTR